MKLSFSLPAGIKAVNCNTLYFGSVAISLEKQGKNSSLNCSARWENVTFKRLGLMFDVKIVGWGGRPLTQLQESVTEFLDRVP